MCRVINMLVMAPVARCSLEVAGRIVLRSEGGPPEAEYALFDASSIELHATEPGAIREVGYRTTVGDARGRLDAMGVTAALARDAAAAMTDARVTPLADLYARGAAARRVAGALGPVELFEGLAYDADARAYAGHWIDVRAVAAECGVEGAGHTVQAP